MLSPEKSPNDGVGVKTTINHIQAHKVCLRWFDLVVLSTEARIWGLFADLGSECRLRKLLGCTDIPSRVTVVPA